MYIGVDLGTSSIKIVLVDRNDKVLEFSSRSIPTERPSIGPLSKILTGGLRHYWTVSTNYHQKQKKI